jgi:hypothetical protein
MEQITIIVDENRKELSNSIAIVMELARQNIVDILDNPEEHAAQHYACDVIEDLLIHVLGD